MEVADISGRKGNTTMIALSIADILTPAPTLLRIYVERWGDPAFWAEPLNALTNASFLIAAVLGLELASRRRATSPTTIGVLSIAGTIGVGSFLFHTVPNYFTMWLDIVPIALFQLNFFWLVTHQMLAMRAWAAAVTVLGIVGLSFLLFPFHKPLNGSLFYLPTLVAMWTLGMLWTWRARSEPYLLVAAAGVFTLALTARTVDLEVGKYVAWSHGTHFLWHMFNGGVVYLALRAWIGFTSSCIVERSTHHQKIDQQGRSDVVSAAV